MKCRYCNAKKTDVINSRKSIDKKEIWRRRKCSLCHITVTTKETVSYDSLFVVKRNLSRRRFVYEKLFSSILVAVSGGKGRDMGDDAMLAKKITKQAVDTLLQNNVKYLPSKEIIQTVYTLLKRERQFFADRYAMYSPFRQKTILKK